MITLARYSFGIGDRFGLQGRALLQAFSAARAHGVSITPVWNKSEREHGLTGTEPADVRRCADAAVRHAGWAEPYVVDADHIQHGCLARYLDCCDFFTIDVAHALAAGLDAAAELGAAYRAMVALHADSIGPRVTANIFARHMCQVFPELHATPCASHNP